MIMIAGGRPWMAGGQARMTVPEAFLRVLKPAASPFRNPRSCRRMTGGGVPAIHLSTLEGAPKDSPDGVDAPPSRVDTSHHKRKKTKTFGLDISTADQAG